MRGVLVVGAGALVGMLMAAGAASAADATASGGFTWQGGYVGIQGGYGSGKDNAVGGYGDPDAQTEPKGWVAGGQIGYNWQFSNGSVVGLEASAAATGMTDTVQHNYTLPPGNVGNTAVTQTLDKYGLFRVRVGAALGPVMPYVSGGVAFGMGTRTADASGNGTCTSPPTVCSGSVGKTFTGWTAGGGVEVAVGDHWSLRGDYAYIDLGTQNFSVPGPNGGSDVNLTASLVTGAINYRW